MIEKVNRDLVAVEINVTDTGFPDDVPALKPWGKAFKKDPRFEFGFTTSVVIGPEGKAAFGTSGCGHKEDYEESASYHPDKYLKFLDGSLDRFTRAKAIVEAAKCRRKESRETNPLC